jgi:hypothetical protein
MGERDSKNERFWLGRMSVRLKGGLGIRQMNQVNEALLDKTAWRDSVSTESYWAKIGSSKYRHNNQDRSCINLL